MVDMHFAGDHGITNGELDGLTAPEAFMLGVEYARIVRSLREPGSLHSPINRENQDRIEAACRHYKRAFVCCEVLNNSSLQLVVEASDSLEFSLESPRLLAIISGSADCPRCGAKCDEPCLTIKGHTFLDGTRHSERITTRPAPEAQDTPAA